MTEYTPETFAASCEVWIAPPLDALDADMGSYVCEVYPNGYTAYRTEAVDRITAEPFYDPSGHMVERIGWVRSWENIDHVRALHQDRLQDCGYVRVL